MNTKQEYVTELTKQSTKANPPNLRLLMPQPVFTVCLSSTQLYMPFSQKPWTLK